MVILHDEAGLDLLLQTARSFIPPTNCDTCTDPHPNCCQTHPRHHFNIVPIDGTKRARLIE